MNENIFEIQTPQKGIRAVSFKRLHTWLDKYGHTTRHFWLQPKDIEYIDEAGTKISLNVTTINDDKGELLAMKQQYFKSKTFLDLPMEERIHKMNSLGMPSL